MTLSEKNRKGGSTMNLDEMLNILGDIIGFSYRQSGNKIIITK